MAVELAALRVRALPHLQHERIEHVEAVRSPLVACVFLCAVAARVRLTRQVLRGADAIVEYCQLQVRDVGFLDAREYGGLIRQPAPAQGAPLR